MLIVSKLLRGEGKTLVSGIESGTSLNSPTELPTHDLCKWHLVDDAQ